MLTCCCPARGTRRCLLLSWQQLASMVCGEQALEFTKGIEGDEYGDAHSCNDHLLGRCLQLLGELFQMLMIWSAAVGPELFPKHYCWWWRIFCLF